MSFHKEPNAEPIPGYRLLHPLGSGGFGEVWKCVAPGGLFKAIKFVYGNLNGLDVDRARAEEERRAIERIKAIRHPFLLSMDRVENIGGELIIVTELADRNLDEVLTAYREQGLPGLPRSELLGYLREAAEVLDLMNLEHSLQHLDIKPRNLFLVSNHVKVADFGLVNSLGGNKSRQSVQLGGISAVYAAPEVFQGKITRSSDQYSLAIVYQELLTGTLPFQGKNSRQLLLLHTKSAPDLGSVSPADRCILTRALSKDPDKRYPTCTDFVSALLLVEERTTSKRAVPRSSSDRTAQGDTDAGRKTVTNTDRAVTTPAPLEAGTGDRFADMVKSKIKQSPLPPASPASLQALNRIISAMITAAGGQTSADGAAPPILSEAEDELRYQFTAGLPPGTARSKLKAFCQEWYGQLIRDDDEGMRFHVSLPANFWRLWIGRQPGLEVLVQLARHHPLSATPIDVTVLIRPFRCNRKRGALLLRDMGATLLEGLRAGLLVNADRRTQDRLLWPHPLKVCPVSAIGSVGETVECRGKDISMTGIGFYLPHELATSQVCIYLPTTVHPPGLSLPATLVRAQRCADGWYDVGALFRLSALRKCVPELCAAH